MNIIITGTNNFIGKNVLKKLIERRCNIIIISSDINKTLKLLKKEKLKIKTYNLSQFQSLKLDTQKKTWTFLHLSGISKNSIFFKNTLKTKNLDSTKYILEFIKRNEIKRFIFLSTLSVFNLNNNLIIDKNLRENPTDDYGKIKLQVEENIKNFCNQNNIKYLILRIPSVYGSKPLGKFKILYFLSKLGIPLPITSNMMKRSYVEINFLVSKILMILKSPVFLNKILYISDEKDYNFEEIVRIIINRKCKFILLPASCINLLKFFGIKLNFYNKIILSKDIKNKL